MSTASEQAAAFLAAKTADRQGERQGATGDYARLRDLIEKDELSDDESEEFIELADKRRAGTLEGRPQRTTYKRPSVAGERADESTTPATKPKTASEQAANFLRGYN